MITEAGFGADLGAEKFFDIKCRSAGLRPDAVVIVATVRALKMHGWRVAQGAGGSPMNVGAVERGLEHLEKHVENVRRFGVPVVVAASTSSRATTESELAVVMGAIAERIGAPAVRSDHWARGGAGAEDLAAACGRGRRVGDSPTSARSTPTTRRSWEQGATHRAPRSTAPTTSSPTRGCASSFHALEGGRLPGHLPVCMAKTQYSFSTDPALKGRPRDFDVPIRDVELRAGAGFVLVLTGDILTMPGLPRVPAAEAIDVDADGRIVGLF